MKVLLLGEYSNVHATLAEGLRHLGHEVLVASNGDFWKDYPRDIDLKRPSGRLGGVRLMLKIVRNLRKLTGFDVVQIINPLFFELKAEWHFFFFRFLKRHNKKIVMGAFGMDYYWVWQNITEKPLRYSDFNIGNKLRTNEEAMTYRADWLGTAKERLNRYCAKNADFIVSGLYEYDVCYRPAFPEKTCFIPFPIKIDGQLSHHSEDAKTHVFIGISKARSAYKGTDIMLKAAEDVLKKYPERMVLHIANGVPFAEYRKMMMGADVILDQLYSYTPAMNALEAMSHGIVVVGGGEPENYEIIGENELRPIVNVTPDYASVYEALENIVLHPEQLARMKHESVEYIKRHHEYIKVAQQYEKLYLM